MAAAICGWRRISLVIDIELELASRLLQGVHLQPDIGTGAIAYDPELLQTGNGLSQQRKSFAGKIGLSIRQACDIPAGMRETADQSSTHRISSRGKDDRDRFGCLLGGGDCRRPRSDDDVHAAVDKVLGYFFKAIRLAVRPAIVDLQIVPADPALVAQLLLKRRNELAPGRMFGRAEKADGCRSFPTLVFDDIHALSLIAPPKIAPSKTGSSERAASRKPNCSTITKVCRGRPFVKVLQSAIPPQ